MAPKQAARVNFFVSMGFEIVQKPTGMFLRVGAGGDDHHVVWPADWDVLFDPRVPVRVPPMAPSAEMVYDLFDQEDMFREILDESGGRFPANGNHEFFIDREPLVDGDGGNPAWTITLVPLGRGAKGKAKGKGVRFSPY